MQAYLKVIDGDVSHEVVNIDSYINLVQSAGTTCIDPDSRDIKLSITLCNFLVQAPTVIWCFDAIDSCICIDILFRAQLRLEREGVCCVLCRWQGRAEAGVGWSWSWSRSQLRPGRTRPGSVLQPRARVLWYFESGRGVCNPMGRCTVDC